MKFTDSDYISGSLSDTPVVHLLQTFHADRATGILKIKSGGSIKQLFLDRGNIVYATSTEYVDRLGIFLLRAGKITREQYDVATALMDSTGKQHGALLVELGFITPQELTWGIRLQVSEITYALIACRDGQFTFMETEIPLTEATSAIPAMTELIKEGIRRCIDEKEIQQIAGFSSNIYEVSARDTWQFHEAHLTAAEQKVLNLCKESKPVEDILRLAEMPKDLVYRIIYTLLTVGMLTDPGKAREGTPSINREEAGNKPYAEKEPQAAKPDGCDVVDHQAGDEPSSEPGPAEETPSFEGVKKKITAFLLAMPGKDHYQLLGVPSTATKSEARSAYLRCTKEYHPDAHAEAEMEDMKKSLETIFARLTKAYDTIMDDGTRKEYDMLLATALPPQRISRQSVTRGQTVETAELERAKTQFSLGLGEFRKGNFWGALDSFLWAVRIQPDNAQYNLYAGKCLSQMPRRRHEAEEYLLKAVELDPYRAEYYVELGEFFSKLGLKSRAEHQFQEALKWQPNNHAALAALGLTGTKDEGKGILGRIFGR